MYDDVTAANRTEASFSERLAVATRGESELAERERDKDRVRTSKLQREGSTHRCASALLGHVCHIMGLFCRIIGLFCRIRRTLLTRVHTAASKVSKPRLLLDRMCSLTIECVLLL